MKFIIILLLAISLVGCATTKEKKGGWYKPDMSQFEKDRYECLYNTQLLLGQRRIRQPRIGVGQQDMLNAQNDLMETIIYNERFKVEIQGCMQARGYRWVEE